MTNAIKAFSLVFHVSPFSFYGNYGDFICAAIESNGDSPTHYIATGENAEGTFSLDATYMSSDRWTITFEKELDKNTTYYLWLWPKQTAAEQYIKVGSDSSQGWIDTTTSGSGVYGYEILVDDFQDVDTINKTPGSGVSSISATLPSGLTAANYSTQVTYQAVMSDGYSFDGWYIDSTKKLKVSSSNPVTLNLGTNRTLYALGSQEASGSFTRTSETANKTNTGGVVTYQADYYTTSSEKIRLIATETYQNDSMQSTVSIVPWLYSATTGKRHIIGRMAIGSTAGSSQQGTVIPDGDITSGTLKVPFNSGGAGLALYYKVYSLSNKVYLDWKIQGWFGYAHGSVLKFVRDNSSYTSWIKVTYGNTIIVNNDALYGDNYLSINEDQKQNILYDLSKTGSCIANGTKQLLTTSDTLTISVKNIKAVGNGMGGITIPTQSAEKTTSVAITIPSGSQTVSIVDKTYGYQDFSVSDDYYANIETAFEFTKMNKTVTSNVYTKESVTTTDPVTGSKTTVGTGSVYITLANTTENNVQTQVDGEAPSDITSSGFISKILTLKTIETTEDAVTKTMVIPSVNIDWTQILTTNVSSIVPMGGTQKELLPGIYLDGENIPLGNNGNTIFIDEGVDAVRGVRDWYLYILEAEESSLIFDTLGSAVEGIDVFICGGGGGGGSGTIPNDYTWSGTAPGTASSITYPSNQEDDFKRRSIGGGGGAGGATRNICNYKVLPNTEYSVTVGYGGAHGMNGNPSTAFDFSAAGGQAGWCGYEDDDETGEERTRPGSESSSSDEEEETDKYLGGEAGEATRTVTYGFSRSGGKGAKIYVEVDKNDTATKKTVDATAGHPGVIPFHPDTVSSLYKGCIPMVGKLYGSGGGGGGCNYTETDYTGTLAPKPGGSSQAGYGGKYTTGGVVNYTNGPLGQDAIDNCGGGGGGGGTSEYCQCFGGAGGSGIIIIRNTRNVNHEYARLDQIMTASASRNKSYSVTTSNIRASGSKDFAVVRTNKNGVKLTTTEEIVKATVAAAGVKESDIKLTITSGAPSDILKDSIAATYNASVVSNGSYKETKKTNNYTYTETLYCGVHAKATLPSISSGSNVCTIDLKLLMWHNNGSSGSVNISSPSKIQVHYPTWNGSTTQDNVIDLINASNLGSNFKCSLTTSKNEVYSGNTGEDVTRTLSNVAFNTTTRSVPIKIVITDYKVTGYMKGLEINHTETIILKEAEIE